MPAPSHGIATARPSPPHPASFAVARGRCGAVGSESALKTVSVPPLLHPEARLQGHLPRRIHSQIQARQLVRLQPPVEPAQIRRPRPPHSSLSRERCKQNSGFSDGRKETRVGVLPLRLSRGRPGRVTCRGHHFRHPLCRAGARSPTTRALPRAKRRGGGRGRGRGRQRCWGGPRATPWRFAGATTGGGGGGRAGGRSREARDRGEGGREGGGKGPGARRGRRWSRRCRCLGWLFARHRRCGAAPPPPPPAPPIPLPRCHRSTQVCAGGEWGTSCKSVRGGTSLWVRGGGSDTGWRRVKCKKIWRSLTKSLTSPHLCCCGACGAPRVLFDRIGGAWWWERTPPVEPQAMRTAPP